MGLLAVQISYFSLFFPEMQGNRTDGDWGRDCDFQVRLKDHETAASSRASDGMVGASWPVARLCAASLQQETSAGGRWRSGWDSNPRYAFGVYTLSRRAPSTTRPPLRMPEAQGTETGGAPSEGRGAWQAALALPGAPGSPSPGR